MKKHIPYVLTGVLFGILLVKAEVVSWFRIQEMFRFQSFHMFGIIGLAILTSTFFILTFKKLKVKTIHGDLIQTGQRKFHKGTIYGGFIFGFGWAITGACPGPMFALSGAGFTTFLIAFIGAIAGTFAFGKLRRVLE